MKRPEEHTGTERWRQAQRYEQAWWGKRARTIDLDYYRAYAGSVLSCLRPHIMVDRETRVLEIGSGAAGIVTFFPSDQRYAFDPLEQYFSSVEKFRDFRDPAVCYFAAKAEDIPCRQGSADLVLLDNVLDHCENVQRVLAQVHRVLATGGVVYVRINTFSRWGRVIRRQLERFQVDQGHPITFTKRALHRELANNGFHVIRSQEQASFNLWCAQVCSGKLKQMLAGAAGIVQKPVMILLAKNA